MTPLYTNTGRSHRRGGWGVAGAGADESPGVGSRCQSRETPAGVGKEQLIRNAPCCLSVHITTKGWQLLEERAWELPLRLVSQLEPAAAPPAQHTLITCVCLA